MMTTANITTWMNKLSKNLFKTFLGKRSIRYLFNFSLILIATCWQ